MAEPRKVSVTVTGVLSANNLPKEEQEEITVVEGGPQRFLLVRIVDAPDGSVSIGFTGNGVTPNQVPGMFRELADGFEKNGYGG